MPVSCIQQPGNIKAGWRVCSGVLVTIHVWVERWCCGCEPKGIEVRRFGDVAVWDLPYFGGVCAGRFVLVLDLLYFVCMIMWICRRKCEFIDNIIASKLHEPNQVHQKKHSWLTLSSALTSHHSCFNATEPPIFTHINHQKMTTVACYVGLQYPRGIPSIIRGHWW